MNIPGSSFKGEGRDFIVQYDIELYGQDEAEILLATLESELENPELPLLAARRVAMQDMREHFEKEEDPNGEAWTSLTEDYQRSKEGAGYAVPEILKREHDLMNAAIDQASWLIADDTLMFDAGNIPEYGYYHQDGTASIESVMLNRESRARHHFRVENEEGYSKETGGKRGSLGVGVGMNLPPRPFIGLSEEAEGKILTIFDAWFMTVGEDVEGEAISTKVAVNPTTGVAQHRTAGGRFGKKII